MKGRSRFERPFHLPQSDEQHFTGRRSESEPRHAINKSVIVALRSGSRAFPLLRQPPQDPGLAFALAPGFHDPRDLVHRLAAAPFLAVLICACSTQDASVGLNRTPADDAAESAARSTMTAVDLGTLGGASSYAAAINSGNTVVGWSETASGASRAFRWNAGEGMVDLGTLPSHTSSRAVAVLDGGEILGLSGDDGRWTPVIWSASGSISVLAIPLSAGFTTVLPTGFNSRGDVVGSDAGALQHGWIWSSNTGKHDLSAVAEADSYEGSAEGVTSAGQVVLTTGSNECGRTVACWRTYLWNESTGYRSLGTPSSHAESVAGLALNELGAVAGWVAGSTGEGTRPYRWSTATGFTVLANYPGGSSSYGYATAINSSGAVAGASLEPKSGSIVASMWLSNGTIVRLSPADPNPSVAVSINDLGTVAGWAAVRTNVNHAVIWKSSTQSSPVKQAPTSVTAFISTASAPCLRNPDSITSRQSLFDCVIRADRKR
jgi:probable HAF family extracellular repeat protein